MSPSYFIIRPHDDGSFSISDPFGAGYREFQRGADLWALIDEVALNYAISHAERLARINAELQPKPVSTAEDLLKELGL